MNRNNLLTEGNEFRLPNGSLYSGRYHIHVSKGAMVGARHVNTEHDFLTPVNRTVEDKVKSIQTELLAESTRREKLKVNSNNQSASSSPTSSGSGGY